MKTTYYITGICGHLGRNILIELDRLDDINIVGLALPSDKKENLISKHPLTIVEGNVLNKDDLDKFLSTNSSEKNIVIHAAGLISIYKHNDDKVTNVNVNGTKNMLEIAQFKHINRFIYISSVDAIKCAPKGEKTKEIDRFDENQVEGVYGKSKAVASNLVLDANSDLMTTVTIHPSALLGPNDYYGGPINTALSKYKNGKLNAIVTGGYDLVDIRDVAYGIVESSIIENPQRSYILSGTPVEIKELINIASKVSGKPSYKICLSSNFVKIFSPIIEVIYKIRKKKPLFTGYSMTCLHRNYLYDCSRAEKDLQYKIRNLEDTVADTLNWVK